MEHVFVYIRYEKTREKIIEWENEKKMKAATNMERRKVILLPKMATFIL